MKIGDIMDIKVKKTKHIYRNGIYAPIEENVTLSARVTSEGRKNFQLLGEDGIRYSILKDKWDRMPR
jgi:hypothetical protein